MRQHAQAGSIQKSSPPSHVICRTRIGCSYITWPKTWSRLYSRISCLNWPLNSRAAMSTMKTLVSISRNNRPAIEAPSTKRVSTKLISDENSIIPYRRWFNVNKAELYLGNIMYDRINKYLRMFIIYILFWLPVNKKKLKWLIVYVQWSGHFPLGNRRASRLFISTACTPCGDRVKPVLICRS